MKKAVELLAENQDNLSAIAEKAGYHGIKTFRRFLKSTMECFRQNSDKIATKKAQDITLVLF